MRGTNSGEGRARGVWQRRLLIALIGAYCSSAVVLPVAPLRAQPTTQYTLGSVRELLRMRVPEDQMYVRFVSRCLDDSVTAAVRDELRELNASTNLVAFLERAPRCRETRLISDSLRLLRVRVDSLTAAVRSYRDSIALLERQLRPLTTRPVDLLFSTDRFLPLFGPIDARNDLSAGPRLLTTEVTIAQWRAVMLTEAKAGMPTGCDDQCPVGGVSYHDVQQFLTALNTAVTSARFRLPTEDEWESAALRVATADPSSCGSRSWTRESGSNGPRRSAGGLDGVLLDLCGNQWEWVVPGTRGSPPGHAVLKGGSWMEFRVASSPSYREVQVVGFGRADYGFRLVREAR
jgi:hypothetical protein